MPKGKKRRVKIKKKTTRKKINGSKSVVLLLFLILLIGIGYFFYSKDVNNSKRLHIIESIPEGFPSFGIDVSHHQGEINWEKLFIKEHYDTIIHFVYCKATEGSDHLDRQWHKNREELQRLLIPNGAYHFFSAKTPPLPQVDHFLTHWRKTETDLPPVLDVEVEGFSDKDLIAKMKIWLIEVENKTGMRPIIYTSLHFFEQKFFHEFKDYKFWIAAYSRKPKDLEDGRIIFWQYSESGRIPGIKENVDFNVSKIIYK